MKSQQQCPRNSYTSNQCKEKKLNCNDSELQSAKFPELNNTSELGFWQNYSALLVS